MSLELRDFWGDFLHYILDSFWAIGQWQVEVLEEDGEARFGTADDAKAEILAGPRVGRTTSIERTSAISSRCFLGAVPRPFDAIQC